MQCQGADLGLVEVSVGGRHVDKHERLGGAAEGVAHEHGELVVAVGDVRLLRGQRTDHIAQRAQALVDCLRLLQLLAR